MNPHFQAKFHLQGYKVTEGRLLNRNNRFLGKTFASNHDVLGLTLCKSLKLTNAWFSKKHGTQETAVLLFMSGNVQSLDHARNKEVELTAVLSVYVTIKDLKLPAARG